MEVVWGGGNGQGMGVSRRGTHKECRGFIDRGRGS